MIIFHFGIRQYSGKPNVSWKQVKWLPSDLAQFKWIGNLPWLSKAVFPRLNQESLQEKRTLGVSTGTFLENAHGKTRI
jgi:hypothetical protein